MNNDSIETIENMSLEEAEKLVNAKEIIEKCDALELYPEDVYQEYLDTRRNVEKNMSNDKKMRKALAAFKHATAVYKIAQQHYDSAPPLNFNPVII